MLIKGIVFDLDHTLYDRYATIEAGAEFFCRRFADRLSSAITPAVAAKLLCDGDRLYIYYGWRRIFTYLCESGMFSDVPEYEEYRDCMLELYSTYAEPFPFTYTVLDDIKGRTLALGLITNGNSKVQRAKLSLLGIERYFDEIIVCGELGISKPEAAPFDEMARRLGIPSKELLYVGDNPINDVTASRNAGYIPVEVLTAECVLEDATPAEHRIRTVAELPALIDKFNN